MAKSAGKPLTENAPDELVRRVLRRITEANSLLELLNELWKEQVFADLDATTPFPVSALPDHAWALVEAPGFATEYHIQLGRALLVAAVTKQARVHARTLGSQGELSDEDLLVCRAILSSL